MKPWMKTLNTEGWYVPVTPVIKDVISKEELAEPRRRAFSHRNRLPGEEQIDEANLIWKYLCEYIDEKGFPPSMRETGKEFGLDQASVRRRMKYLEKMGYIKMHERIARGVVIINRPSQEYSDEAS